MTGENAAAIIVCLRKFRRVGGGEELPDPSIVSFVFTETIVAIWMNLKRQKTSGMRRQSGRRVLPAKLP
jgi:hypothetical protein